MIAIDRQTQQLHKTRDIQSKQINSQFPSLTEQS